MSLVNKGQEYMCNKMSPNKGLNNYETTHLIIRSNSCITHNYLYEEWVINQH